MLGTVLFMARDAGAATVLAPVARTLLERYDTTPAIVAYGKAAPAFEAGGLPAIAFPEEPDPEQVARLLEREGAAALLTGTSMRTERDARFWDGARIAGVPSVAVLDHWRNYAERFTIEEPFDRLPDVLAVMDECAAREYERLGLPADRIAVTGHPHLSSLAPVAPAERSQARRELGIDAARPVVVFASELLSAHYGTGPERPSYLGYTEHDAAGALADALAAVGPDALLLVKLHPLEPGEAFLELTERDGPPQTRVLRAYAPRKTIALADLVTGMTSTFLLEAALMGVPALSIRPGELRREHFIAIHAQSIPSVVQRNGVARAVAGALAGPREPHVARFEPGATERVIRLVAQRARAAGTLAGPGASQLALAGGGGRLTKRWAR